MFNRMLRGRIGDQAFFAALDALANERFEQLVTTAQLRAAFERASGRDLADFFDYWVEGGRLPALTLEFSREKAPEGEVISGTVTSSVPYGRLDVPVVIQDGRQQVVAWVEVEDGRGTFTQPTPMKRPKVELDPKGLVLARLRRVKGG